MTVSLTLFTTCKAFQGPFATIQRNALRSWEKLCPPCEVIVFGNEAGVEEYCQELRFKQIPEVARSKFGTPLLSDLFQQADQTSNNDYLAYVNADIILTRELVSAAEITAKRFQKFLLIARRWNVELDSDWDFERGDWELELRRYVTIHGTLEPPYGGVDLFVYPRGIWNDLPPFAIGRTRWDSALIYRARRRGIPVIDATETLLAVHQNHDYSHNAHGTAGVFKGPEAIANENLLGGEEFIFTSLNATHVMKNSGIRRNVSFFPPYLLRKMATLPALYPLFNPLAPAVRKFAPWWRRLQTIRSRLITQESLRLRFSSSNNKPALYIFVHLSKTGGTTFHSSYLPAAFLESERFVLNGEPGHNAEDISRLIQLPQHEKSKFKIIAGHNTFGLHRYFNQAKYIVVLRNPVDRVFSAYMHAKYHLPDSEGAKYMNERQITLEEFVTNPPPAHLFGFGITGRNGQLNALLQRTDTTNSVSDEFLQTLLDQFAFVGLTEQLDLFLFYLHVKIDFPLVLYNNRLVRQERKAFSVSGEQKRLIEEINQSDVKLYRLAKARFAKGINEIWSEETAVKWIAFRAMLENFRHRTGHDENKAQKIKLDLLLS